MSMTMFEYMRVVTNLEGRLYQVDGKNLSRQIDIDEFLGDIGADGWEACGDGCVVPSTIVHGYSQIQYLFKRPLN